MEAKESETATIELPADEPEIIRRLIEFFYRGNYSRFETNAPLGHAQVYAAAGKYLMEPLCVLAAFNYTAVTTVSWDEA